jgi:NADH-quinone oxidoreductase subunit C
VTAEELLAALGIEAATASEAFGRLTVDVPGDDWVAAATAARDRLDAGFFDWLSAYDDKDAGLAVVTHAWSVGHRESVTLRTRVPRDGGRLPTLTGVWAGANWHERETFEMFGIGFDGHPNLVPLLLPDGFEGNPLRKEFVLASRVAKAWPGQKEPGESDHDLAAPAADAPPAGDRAERRPRRRMLPPGVPEPGSWGPEQ